MPPKKSLPKSRDVSYYSRTRHPLNNLIFVVPFIVVFHMGLGLTNYSLAALEDIDRILKYFGAAQAYLPPILVVAVLLAHQLFGEHEWKAEPKIIVGMLAECVLWMTPLILMGYLTGRMLANMAAQQGGQPVAGGVLTAIGAGIYEEFIFRMFFISFILLIFTDIANLPRHWVTLAAVFAGAVLFSLYHFSGQQLSSWSEFPWAQFWFRGIAGVYLGAIYVVRGFGIAVGTHAFYNIFTVFYSAQ